MAEQWNDDKTQVTLDKADFEQLKNQATDSFNKGYGQGRDKGKNDILSAFSDLGIDAENYSSKAKDLKKQLSALNDPAKLKELLGDEIQNLDAVQKLQQKLQNAEKEKADLQSSFDAFKESQLIDNTIITIARTAPQDGSRNEPFNDLQVMREFKADHKIIVGKDNKVEVLDLDGNPILHDGKVADLSLAHELWAKKNLHLYKGVQNGGSGDGPAGGRQVRTVDDLKTDAEKSQYIKQHGAAAYKELVNAKYRQPK